MSKRCWAWWHVAAAILAPLAGTNPAFAQVIDFGNYHALLIANEGYTHWKPLRTPFEDVDDLDIILRKQYGFKTTVIRDATRDDIIDELEVLKGRLTSNDNLLIYYAGHGKIREEGGYWIGVDASKSSSSRWLDFNTINRLIDADAGMSARQILVIADSCYSGAALRNEDTVGEQRANEGRNDWLQRIAKMRSRTILTSGGEEPVLDGVGKSRNSVFARELLSRLRNNEDVLDADALHDLIKIEVHSRAKSALGAAAQAPEYGAILGTGHAGGDFLFRPENIQIAASIARSVREEFGIRGSEPLTNTLSQLVKQAFDEASVAGNQLYDRIKAKVIREQRIADAPTEPGVAAPAGSGETFILTAENPLCPYDRGSDEPYPTCFDPARFAPGRAGEPDSLLVRRRALATIMTFNTVALRVASGEAVEELGVEEVHRLGSNASSFATLNGVGAMGAPLIGLTSELAAQLATWAETLRADQELRSALDAGSPLIEQLLVALIDDTPIMYALKREEVAAQADALTAQARDIEFDVVDMMHAQAAPQGSMVAELAQRDLHYNNARARFGLAFQSLVALAGQGSQPFTEQNLDLVDGKIAQLEPLAEQYQEQVEAANQYYEALGKYAVLLHRINELLDLVTVPASPGFLSQQATEIREQALDIQKLLNS